MVRGTVTSTRPNIFYLQSLNPPKLGNSLELGEGKKFRDFGRQQWALVDIGPAAQNAAKGKHGFVGSFSQTSHLTRGREDPEAS